MNLKQFIDDDAAVSPVIGVILMVAITVILAAVIGTFVLGLGESVQTSPQVKMSFDYNQSGTQLTITHDGGDSFEAENVRITGGGNDASWNASLGTPDVNSYKVQAGNTTTVGDSDVGWGETESAVNSSDTIRVVWQNPDTDKSATLARWTGPDA